MAQLAALLGEARAAPGGPGPHDGPMDVALAGALTAARRRREAETRLMREGLDAWRCKQQQLLAKKALEQKQLREMLLTYSPWGRPGGGAPNSDTIRKRKALQLETLYGAPPSTSPGASPASSSASASGNNLHGSGCQTLPRLPSQPRYGAQPQAPRRLRSDPLLLFQFQEADRRAVDNMLRYRTDPRQQEQYRHELDRMVQEKRLRQQQQQQKQLQQHQRQQQLQQQHQLQQEQQLQQQLQQNGHQEAREMNGHKDSVRRRRSAGSSSEQPQRDKNWAGVELVPLLDRRRYPNAPDDPLSPTPRARARLGAHLPTTDVTNVTKVKEDVSQEREQTYRDLAAQIDRKRRQMEVTRAEEMERSRQHFETWQMLWGRPGHGAPRDVKVKENLDVILYHLDQPRGGASPSPPQHPQPQAAAGARPGPAEGAHTDAHPPALAAH